jgi:Predicted membrane protein
LYTYALKRPVKYEIIKCKVYYGGEDMNDFLQAFALIFIAEMGDKTQIMAMAFATQYKIKQILIGVFIGAFINHGLAIMLGSVLTQFIPIEALQLVAGVLFIAFGLLSLSIAEDEEENLGKNNYGAIVTVSLAFFLGELGDKTQLTALTLSTQSAIPFLTLMGTVTGMVVVSSVGIFIGAKLGNKIPEHFIRVGAFIIFMSFGLSKIISSEYVISMGTTFVSLLLGIILVLTIFRGLIFTRQLKEVKVSALKQHAEDLKNYRKALQSSVDHLCKGCSVCKDSICLVGYMKALLSDRVTPDRFDSSIIESLEVDAFDVSKAQQVKFLLEDYYKEYPDERLKNAELMSIEAIINRIIHNNSMNF